MADAASTAAAPLPDASAAPPPPTAANLTSIHLDRPHQNGLAVKVNPRCEIGRVGESWWAGALWPARGHEGAPCRGIVAWGDGGTFDPLTVSSGGLVADAASAAAAHVPNAPAAAPPPATARQHPQH